MLTENPTCTRCGRRIPSGETMEVTRTVSDHGLFVKVLCALHTDHEIAGEWHDE